MNTTTPTTVKKLSFPRLVLTFLIIGGIVYGGVHNAERLSIAEERAEFAPWFAAYVDVTSTPTYAFEKREAVGGPQDAVLAFIVAHPTEGCTPTWGGYFTMNEAASALDLDRRIARLQQQGGRIAVSFGGALNSELALACADADKLFDAYTSVIDRYNVTTIDLDLENESLRDPEASKRRAEVVAKLQETYTANEKVLNVWLTLPVAPQGMTEEGTNAIAVMLEHGVDIAGVNLMTMDYGGSRDPSLSMYEASRSALVEAHRQLGILYQRAGISLSSASLWAKIGATPMIGQNDVVDEIFTVDDAVALNAFALERGVGRMSMWSANRDIPCGENYVDVKVVSDVCSGVTSPASAFTRALAAGFKGDLLQQATMITLDPAANTLVVDDPLKSPYPIWRETGVYLKGDKVVWHGNVYEAKWWTKKDLPDNPVLQSWETPWQLIGPVLPTDTPMEILVLPPYVFPEWSGLTIYNAGDRVMFDGAAFRAKWWNQGESPATSAASPESSPWIPLTREQIREILGN